MLLKEQRHIVSRCRCNPYHSKENNPCQIFEFAKKFIKSKYFKPMVGVPSSYSKTYEKDLIKMDLRLLFMQII